MEGDPTRATPITVISRWALIVAVLLVAGYVRFTGLNWDEGQWIHPDEGHMRIITSVIRMPDSLSLYFDTHNSPLNSRNSGQVYSYGTLPLFLTRMTAEWLDRSCDQSPPVLNALVASLLISSPETGGSANLEPGHSGQLCSPGTFTGSRSAQVGRALSALADLGTVCLMYLIGRRLYGEAVGLLAAGLGSVTAFLIQQAHFYTVDSMACFFVVLSVYFSVRAGRSGSWISFGLAGLATGLATACKVSAAILAALPVVLGGVWWVMSQSERRGVWTVLWRLLLAGLLSLVAFRVAQPYAFEGPGFFGVRPSPDWFERLGQIGAEQGGEIDLPSGRQWTDRAPLLFPGLNMLVWGMGIPLGLAASAGWALAGFELWHGQRAHLVPWAWATLTFLYLGTRWVKTMRYFLPLYPVLVILAAYALVRLARPAPRSRPASSRRYRPAGLILAALVVGGAVVWGSAVFSIYLRPHTRLAASRWIFAHVPEGTTVANEHWDWGLPLRVDGHDPFGGMYLGIEMQHYDEDTPEKRARLYEWLEEADYIFLASNRLYASISRLPARYPLTTAYYRALFAGDLGFDLAADFTSYPAFGPFQFPDQECPYPLMAPDYVHQRQPIVVHLPPAEEAFSVYDHPRVLIFRKTAAYSRQRVEQVLGGIDVQRALHGLTPAQATAAPDLLEFDSPATWAAQQAGGTWSDMFDRQGLLNRYPGLAAVAWWAVVAGLGWLAFPLLFVALPRLRDRGYGLTRVLGLLVVAYLTWLAASLRMLPNTRGTILRMVALLALTGGGVGWFRRAELRRFLRRRWHLVLLTEGLFALLYATWIGVRLLHPDLWHPIVGGEKPMDLAYLNAVMKSTWFPPYNPWFSGSYINYYYFGFVIVGTLIKLMGTLPAIAYNLAVPLLFALTGVGAFSVAYNLFGGHERGGLRAGVAALAFTVALGNLGVVRLIRASLIKLGGQPFPSTIPAFAQTVSMLKGLWQVIAHGATLPLRPESWYWDPTRIIPAGPGEVGPITEFPAFTFLYADLHAHMIAFPLTLLALALAVHWMRSPRPRWPSLLIGGLVIGALRPTNTWDYPTYLVLGVAALALGAFRSWKSARFPAKSEVWALAWRVLSLVGLTVLLYLPYIRHYVAGYTSFEVWSGSRTPFNIYLWIHGALLFPLVTRMLIEVGRGGIADCSARTGDRGRLRLALALGLSGLLGVMLVLVPLGYEVALAVVPLGAGAAYLILRPGMPTSRRFLWLAVGAGLALSLVVEVLVLKGDIGRMNTVFKFYLQVWILFAVAAGVSLAWVQERARRWAPEWRKLWWGGMAALIFGCALFLPYGVRARAIDRMAPEAGLTLDGEAFMKYGLVVDGAPERGSQEIPLSGDYAAIHWMQDTIQGAPVILEGLGYREYLWGNRVSVYTGLPAVVGWRWHQVQQRAALPDVMVDWRRDDVRECYDTTDVARAWDILERYGVRYVYVGAYERAYYDPAGLAKFDRMAAQELLQVVYDAQGVRIYEVALDAQVPLT